MRLSSLHEATTPWAGQLYNYLGNGAPYTVNYGTGDRSRAPLLYIQVPLTDIRALLKRVQKGVVWFDDAKRTGGILFGDRAKILRDLRDQEGLTVVPHPNPRHTGEAHITIVQDFYRANPPKDELTDALRNLAATRPELNQLPTAAQAAAALLSVRVGDRSLFPSPREGMRVPVRFARDFTVWRSFGYRDEYDPAGPLQISLSVDPTPYNAIRRALGLSATTTIPGSGAVWVPHVGIGYIARRQFIDRDYVQKHGSTPRTRSAPTTTKLPE